MDRRLRNLENTPGGVVDEHIVHMKTLLNTPLSSINFSLRTYNMLQSSNMNTLGDLVQYEVHELLKMRNFNKRILIEVEELLVEKGLTFGMDLSRYNL